MLPSAILILYLFIFLISHYETTGNECDNYKSQCNEQKDCHSCIEAHYCCEYFYGNLENSTRPRCDINIENERAVERNSRTKHKVTKDENFSTSDIIQLKPQGFNIKLRKGEPHNITFQYKPVKDYPLDLYYLIDISHNMKDHMNDLKNLAEILQRELQALTKEWKLGLGLFMDKFLFPFSRMEERFIKNPCRGTEVDATCHSGYAFKHQLNFTRKGIFYDKVANINTTANLDDRDGASLAIMQALCCQREFNWRENSRKLILLATSSKMHFAGDGLLAGAIKPHPHQCLDEERLNSNEFDYPAIGDIMKLLKEMKTNLVIAAKDNNEREMRELQKLLDKNAYMDILDKDNPHKILDVITKAYNQFFQTAKFYVNETIWSGEIRDYLKVDFFTNCSGKMELKDSCNSITPNSIVNFTVQLTLTKKPPVTEETIFIQERSIGESIDLNIEYKGVSCQCRDKVHTDAEQFSIPCHNGKVECDECICEEGMCGKNCDKQGWELIDLCRKDGGSICSQNGECKCGKCHCDLPYSGEYCEEACPWTQIGVQVCNGFLCENGTCICPDGYSGNACQCTPRKCNYMDLECYGNGRCECDECICNEGFTGKYCTKDEKGVPLYCEIVKDCVRQIYVKDTPCNMTFSKNVPNRQDDIEYDCSLRLESDGQDAKIIYTYLEDKKVLYHYLIKSGTKQALLIPFTGIFAGIIVIGLIIMVLYKLYNNIQDKKEYDAFLKAAEKRKMIQMNPLYKPAQTHYTNPMHAKMN